MISISIGIILLGCIVWAVSHTFSVHTLFKDGRNPYTRICKKCEQSQNYFQSVSLTGKTIGWWEDMYPIKDETCKCHEHQNPYNR